MIAVAITSARGGGRPSSRQPLSSRARWRARSGTRPLTARMVSNRPSPSRKPRSVGSMRAWAGRVSRPFSQTRSAGPAPVTADRARQSSGIQLVSMLGQHRLRMELDADDRELPVAQAHDLALLAPRRHLAGSPAGASSRDDQRVVAGHLQRVAAGRRTRRCRRGGRARSCRASAAARARPRRRRPAPMHWWPRHTPRIGTRRRSRVITALLMPASVGVQGPGEMMMWRGRQGRDVVEAGRVVAHHDPRVAELADVAGEVPDEAVVVVDQQDHQPLPQRLDQRPRLVQRLLVLGRRVAVGDDAAAGLEGHAAGP